MPNLFLACTHFLTGLLRCGGSHDGTLDGAIGLMGGCRPIQVCLTIGSDIRTCDLILEYGILV